MLKLMHYKNVILFSEVINCAGIQIQYKGKFIGESKLSDDWYVATNKKKIMIVSLTGNQDVSELFEFEGDFNISKIIIATSELERVSCGYEKLDIDYFNKSPELFQSGGSYFSDYNSKHEEIITNESINITKNNLFTKQDEFYLENGDNYFGEYHQHSNGQAMSESYHIADSVNIYRKDENNKLYKPQEKISKTFGIDEEFTPSRDLQVEIRADKYKPGFTEKGTGQEGVGGGGSGGY